MDLEKARGINASSATASRAHLALALDWSLRERDKLEAHSAEQERLRALGGIPPKVDGSWRNERDVPPPASAADPRLALPPQWRHAPRILPLPQGDDAA